MGRMSLNFNSHKSESTPILNYLPIYQFELYMRRLKNIFKDLKGVLIYILYIVGYKKGENEACQLSLM